eukprot:jgi/Picre1/30877/NNA_006236.t1
MEFIGAYGDDDGEKERNSCSPREEVTEVIKSCAPEVFVTDTDIVEHNGRLGSSVLPAATARHVEYNLPRHLMHAPVAGPRNPGDSLNMPVGTRNHWSGQAEDAHMNSFAFDDQYNTFSKSGAAVDPHSGDIVGKSSVAAVQKAASRGGSTRRKKQKLEAGQSQRPESGIALDRPFVLKTRQPWAEDVVPVEQELTEAQQEYVAALNQEKEEKAALSGKEDYSIFHGLKGEDYQGRTWVDIPSGLQREPDGKCFLPKRVVHAWTGHSKGVNSIQFFPSSGHLLLSGGLDGKAKIWKTTGGREFLTAAYDKGIKLWDTETGSMLQRFGDNSAMAYTVRTHPDPSQPDVLLAGMHNKKILQFDMRSGDVVQEYNYHLGPVNTITFIDENRKFLSTSDDKSIRVWEFGVPVQAKCLADPSMHAISSAATSPSGKWWLGQSADNRIVTYSASESVRHNKKKTFGGHSSAGYACQIGVSHDGQYVYSGDGEGKVFIWSWKTKKILRSLKAHEGVCIGCQWHPTETSKIATCGWDSTIRLWD